MPPLCFKRVLTMAKVLATEIRIGHLLEWEKRIWRGIKCYHVHVGGRGGAFLPGAREDNPTPTTTQPPRRPIAKVRCPFPAPRHEHDIFKDGTALHFLATAH